VIQFSSLLTAEIAEIAEKNNVALFYTAENSACSAFSEVRFFYQLKTSLFDIPCSNLSHSTSSGQALSLSKDLHPQSGAGREPMGL